MGEKVYKNELKAYFEGSVLKEYKKQAESENIRMLNVLGVASLIFSMVLCANTIVEREEYGLLGNTYFYLFLAAIFLLLITQKVLVPKPKLIPWMIAVCYLVWASAVTVENCFFGVPVGRSAYYVLIGLGCSFLVHPVYMLLLQFGAAVLIGIGISLYKPLDSVIVEELNIFILMLISAGISLVALYFRLNSLRKIEEREQIFSVTALYQSILDETQTGVYVRELGSYELLYMNRKAREIFQIAGEEPVLGQRCYQVFYHQQVACVNCPSRNRNKNEALVREVVLGGRYYTVKGKIIDWEGREAYVEYLTDITDAKQMSEQMRIAHEHLERKYEEEVLYRAKALSDDVLCTSRVNLTEGIVEEMRVGKEDGYEREYRHAIDFSQRILAFTKENWLTPEQEQELSREGMLAKFEAGIMAFSTEYIVELNSGRHAWMRMEVKLLRRPETSEVMAFCYNRNITGERLIRHVLESIMSFEYDEIYTVDVKNCRFEGIGFGQYALDEQNITDPYEEKIELLTQRAVLAKDRKKIRRELSIEGILRRLEKEQMHSMEATLVSKNGKPRRKRIRYMYLYKNVGTVLVTITDIEDVARVEKAKQGQLEEALLMAKEASYAKSRFLASMSHEIRTPMNAIIGLNTIIKEEIDNHSQVLDCSEKLDSASKYLLALLNDILDMSQIESGNMTLAHQEFAIDKFWDNVNMLAKAQADIASVTYLFVRKNTIQGMYVGDATRLQQILINLINNAIKFTSVGGYVRVTADEWEEEDGKAGLRVEVEDNGIGISKEFLPEVFGTFKQQHAEDTTVYKGSGLGLSIAQNFARMMDGDITVRSEEGVGTTFVVTVKLDFDRTAATRAEEKEETSCERDFTGKKVLLVEDHPLNTIVAKSLLAKRGFEVVHAQNGEEAVRCFVESGKREYDVILMDIRMPVMDGIEASMKIRELKRKDAKEIPIIAMTANAYEEDRQRTSEAGMNAHLAKPIDPSQLFKTLGDFIR